MTYYHGEKAARGDLEEQIGALMKSDPYQISIKAMGVCRDGCPYIRGVVQSSIQCSLYVSKGTGMTNKLCIW